MIQVPQKAVKVSVSVRLEPDTIERVRVLAETLSVGHMKVTEGAVLRQIITDFFSPNRSQNANEETR